MKSALFFLFPSLLFAQMELAGNADIGIWHIRNNVSGNPQFQTNDGVNGNLVENSYTLLQLGLQLDAKNWFQVGEQNVNGHFRGRGLFNAFEDHYTLGPSDRARIQLDELNIEMSQINNALDLWLGRQVIYEAGGAGVDGVRAIYHLRESTDIAAYGGLGTDPRNLNGYIGPSYRTNPINLNFQSAGLYTTYRGEQFKIDSAFRSDFYKGSVDRLTIFSQTFYQLNSVWSFSALAEGDIAGKIGITKGQLSIINRPVPRVTHTLTGSMYRAIIYDASDASAIPVTTGINSALVGGVKVNDTYYFSAGNDLTYRLARNYLFGGVQFSRRTFDNENRIKYTVGYRDPFFLGGRADLRVQTDVIQNFRGFNVALDGLIGKDFYQTKLRLEGGGSYFANERDVFQNGAILLNRQTEKEFALRANAYLNQTKSLSWFLAYALYFDQDTIDANQKVQEHSILLSSNIRF